MDPTIPAESDAAEVASEHRRVLLRRTRTAAGVAAWLLPLVLLAHATRASRHALPELLVLATGVGVLSTLLWWRLGWKAGLARLERHFHLPFFFLITLGAFTGALLLRLGGGALESDSLPIHLLALFAVAAFFPARLGWAAAAAALQPLAYATVRFGLLGAPFAGRPFADCLLLLESALVATVANGLTTRIFFREAWHRSELESANRRQRELDRAKSDFFANLSHDLRSPLTVVLGPLSAILNDTDTLDPRHRHYLELALGGAARLDSMINDILELARIDSGVGVLNPAPVELRELTGSLVTSIAPYAATLGVKLSFEPPDTPLTAMADTDKLERILMNLISNGCKFSGSGTEVTVSLRDAGENIELSVRDQGPGIAPEELEHIFGRFARSKDEGLSAIGGTGLGLAVVKQFVEMHRGQVGVTSKLGEGAVFTVKLPKAMKGLPAQSAPPSVPITRSRPPPHLLISHLDPHRQAAAPGPAANGPRLLLVEDTPEVRQFLVPELGRSFKLKVAFDGSEALRLAHDTDPELVILDIMLPGMDGFELCRRLRADPQTATVPVIAFSARGDVQTRLDAFAAGADDFLHKPFEARELRARIDSLLRRAAGKSLGGAPAVR